MNRNEIYMNVVMGERHEKCGMKGILVLKKSHEAKSLEDINGGEIILDYRLYTKNEYYKHAERKGTQTFLTAIERRNSGLNHPVWGHMNKHYLKMKYKRLNEKKLCTNSSPQ